MESAPLEPDTTSLSGRAAHGCPQAWLSLYERFTPALYTWAALRIRPDMRAELAAEDLVQDIWSRALVALPERGGSPGFRYWLFKVARNILLEVVRHWQRRKNRGLAGSQVQTSSEQSIVDASTPITRRVARDESVRAFIEWVKAQETDEAQILVACGLEGHSTSAVARRLGREPDAVRKQWQRLRERLRDQHLPPALRELLLDPTD